MNSTLKKTSDKSVSLRVQENKKPGAVSILNLEWNAPFLKPKQQTLVSIPDSQDINLSVPGTAVLYHPVRKI